MDRARHPGDAPRCQEPSTGAIFATRYVRRWARRRLLLVFQVSKDPTGRPTIDELHRIWVSATADSISKDLDRATALAEAAPAEEREEAARYVAALWRLERWLHDR